MDLKEIVQFLGKGKNHIAKPALAELCGVSYQSVKAWFDAGEIPELRQHQIENLTNGALKADPKFKANQQGEGSNG